MIKDKIIELINGVNYYILEEISYNNKKYVLAAECDLEKDEINQDKYIVMEIKVDGNDLITADIEDEDLAKNITQKLIDEVRKSDK